MRAVIQRVSSGSVTVEGEICGRVGVGLVVLLAVAPEDGPEDIEWLSGKITRLRIFDDEGGVMNKSIQEVDGDVLLISQFTLFASTRKGNRPSHTRSAAPELARRLYESFQEQLSRDLQKAVQTGHFGADMAVSLVNDGPVTIIIDSRLRE